MADKPDTRELAHELALAWMRGQDTSELTPTEFIKRLFAAEAEIKSALPAPIAEKGVKWFGMKPDA